ncbi:hypothetical protein FF38_01634 [Lucilia cuprina]|uniref:Uncharacterized protein n=1 Tax=Lucilia cuprina TaxID=7375 RepID=A0A0L0BX55_LUCCU|nr:hypothetical protein FF38_01634 [Lucilia cuprina]
MKLQITLIVCSLLLASVELRFAPLLEEVGGILDVPMDLLTGLIGKVHATGKTLLNDNTAHKILTDFGKIPQIIINAGEKPKENQVQSNAQTSTTTNTPTGSNNQEPIETTTTTTTTEKITTPPS